MDEDLLSSPSHRETGSPDDEVRDIVNSLVSSTYLNPTVEKFLQDPLQKDLFFEVFSRQANLIKSRCQSFDDGHVTVYDKVLLSLTENGNRFDSVAAQEYFCEEFLGISRDGDPIEAEKILQQNLVLKAIIAQATYPQGKYGDKYSAETRYGARGQHHPQPSTAEAKEDDMDAKIARLTSIYEKARSDFEAVPARDTVAKLNAARFLRDTAENTVMYFRDPTKTGKGYAASSNMKELITDLERTCKIAQASVVSLSGGRKRKFDRHDYEVLPRSARGNIGYQRNYKRRGSGSITGGRTLGGDRPKVWQESKKDVRGSAELLSQRSESPRDRRPSAQYRAFEHTRVADSYQPGSEADAGSHGHPYPQQQQQQEDYPRITSSADYGYESREEHPHPADPSSRYAHSQEQRYGYGYSYGHGYGSHGGGQQRQQQQQYNPEGQGEPRPRGRGRGSYHESGSRAERAYSSYRRRSGHGGGYPPHMGY